MQGLPPVKAVRYKGMVPSTNTPACQAAEEPGEALSGVYPLVLATSSPRWLVDVALGHGGDCPRQTWWRRIC